MLELLRARYLFVLWLVLGVVLIDPQYLRGKLGLAAFLESYGAWAGVIFLVSFMLWLVKTAEWTNKRIEGRRESGRLRRKVLNHLKTLPEPDNFILSYCIDRNTRTVYLRLHDAVGLSLVHKGLLEEAQGHPTMSNAMRWPYEIPQFVWDLIYENSDIRNSVLQRTRRRITPGTIDNLYKIFEETSGDTRTYWTEACGFPF